MQYSSQSAASCQVIGPPASTRLYRDPIAISLSPSYGFAREVPKRLKNWRTKSENLPNGTGTIVMLLFDQNEPPPSDHFEVR